MLKKMMNIKASNIHASKRVVSCPSDSEEFKIFQRASWQFRTLGINKAHPDWNVCFITLTYNDRALPCVPDIYFKDGNLQNEKVSCFSRSDIRALFQFVGKWIRKYVLLQVAGHGVRNYSDLRKKYKNLDKSIPTDFHFKISDYCQYLLCGEFGPCTQRPHYHGCLLLSPRIEPRLLYDLIEDFWCGTEKVVPKNNKISGLEREAKGFICPRYFEGGTDSKGNKHKPFVAENKVATIRYASKYACKDMYYNRYVSQFDFTEDRQLRSELKRNYFTFHAQTKGFGLCFLDTLDDVSRIDALYNGVSFVGFNNRLALPIYIKNHILFNNKYLYHEVSKDFYDAAMDFTNREIYNPISGELMETNKHLKYEFKVYTEGGKTHYLKRCVRREATDFFDAYKGQIFDARIENTKKQFGKLLDENYYCDIGKTRTFGNMAASYCRDIISRFGGLSDFARHFVVYYGVPLASRDPSVDEVSQWFERYVIEYGDYWYPSAVLNNDNDFEKEKKLFKKALDNADRVKITSILSENDTMLKNFYINTAVENMPELPAFVQHDDMLKEFYKEQLYRDSLVDCLMYIYCQTCIELTESDEQEQYMQDLLKTSLYGDSENE